MSLQRRQVGAVGAVLGMMLMLAASTAPAAMRTPRLRLGSPRLMSERTVAVPVKLMAKRRDEVAALNFTVRYDAARLEVAKREVVVGRAVKRARAELASKMEPDAGAVRVLVVPEFSPEFGVLWGKHVATVYLRIRGPVPQALGRWVRRHVKLEDVVLGNRQGHQLRSTAHRKGR